MEAGVWGDLRARSPAPDTNEARGLIPVGGAPGRSAVYGGASAGGDGTVTGAAGQTGGDAPGAYRLNFENADIKDVVRAVLGDALQVEYTISPDVSGAVTVSSARPVARGELLGILETVLSAQGFQLAKSGKAYKVGPAAPGAGTVDVGARTTPGYGISILPLTYVSAKTMMRLLGGFVVDSEGVRVDAARNALVVMGPGPKRDEVIRTALSFDADFMAKQTVGIFELQRSTPEPIIAELERLFDSKEAGGGSGVIQFQAIKRLRAVMAISKSPALIARAETWVRRLDRQSEETGENIFVYRARYRDAKELSRLLQGLFGADGDTSGNAGGPQSQPTPQPDEPATADGASAVDGGAQASVAGSSGAFAGEEAPTDTAGGSVDSRIDAAFAAPDVIDLTTQQAASGAIRISADLANNSVVTFTDKETYRKVLATLRQLDSAPLQVAIQATIAEVQLNNDLKYGVQYFLKSNAIGADDDEGSISFQKAAGAVIGRQVPGFNFLVGSRANPDLIINALDSVTNVEILSSPSLVVMENQTAALQVGDDVPVAVTQRQNTSTSTADDPNIILNEIEYRNTGIILKVTPRIGDNGAVTMKIDQEISNVSGRNELGPTFSKRSVSSQISVVSGQTVVLAGLISTKKDLTRAGLPLLNRMAGLRDVTGNTEKNGSRNELVVLIKPVVIEGGDDAQAVAEDLRSRMWAIGNRERQSP
jgi:general secretion pathway protein D